MAALRAQERPCRGSKRSRSGTRKCAWRRSTVGMKHLLSPRAQGGRMWQMRVGWGLVACWAQRDDSSANAESAFDSSPGTEDRRSRASTLLRALQLDESFPWLALYSIVQLRLTEPRSGSESLCRRSSNASAMTATDTTAIPIHSIIGMLARYPTFNRARKNGRVSHQCRGSVSGMPVVLGQSTEVMVWKRRTLHARRRSRVRKAAIASDRANASAAGAAASTRPARRECSVAICRAASRRSPRARLARAFGRGQLHL
jgi:hypothetical protein